MANTNRKSQTNLASWRSKLSSILTSPTHSSSQQSKEQEETELKSVEDWQFIEIESSAMDSASSAEGTPTGLRKKSAKSSPSLVPRSSSVSGTRSPRSLRSPSGSSLQRSVSNRSKKPSASNLEVVQNGRPSQRSDSPGRSISGPARSSSPNRSPLPRKSALSSGGRTASPNSLAPESPVPAHQNGTKSGTGGDESSLASKFRDTFRISRPKKKKGKGKGLAYSVTPVEINMNSSSKYSDPFETSYAEGTDNKIGHDHDFKAASIPHNKPEYCDHCGETAWGLYRQVLKCSSKFRVHSFC